MDLALQKHFDVTVGGRVVYQVAGSNRRIDSGSIQ